MRSIKSYFFMALGLVFWASSPLAGQIDEQTGESALTVSERITMAGQINAEIMQSKLAEAKAEKLANQNEVSRMEIAGRDLANQKNTSKSEIDELRAQLGQYQQLFENRQPSAPSNIDTGRTGPAPINMRVLNILKGDGITSRARVVVLKADGSVSGEFQVKEGNSIQGWNVETINSNTVDIARDGKTLTFGNDGLL